MPAPPPHEVDNLQLPPHPELQGGCWEREHCLVFEDVATSGLYMHLREIVAF